MKRASLPVLAMAAAAFGAAGPDRAAAQPFNPIRELSTWYTDRSLVDIEVSPLSGMLREPQRQQHVLRFRLERAYVDKLIAEKESGRQTIGFAFDMETGLPTSLYEAAANRGRFHEDVAGIPILSSAQRAPRTLLISITSDSDRGRLEYSSDSNSKCAGAPLGNRLRVYNSANRKLCMRPSYPRGSLYVADYDNNLALRIQCQQESFPGMGCHLLFPFEAFGVELNFHRDHLARWREMVDRASEFLQSKRYR
jgi:hypothetical protein